jgi:preprotein translocase subunit SecG
MHHQGMHPRAGPPPQHPVQITHPAHPAYMEKVQQEGVRSTRGVSSAAATEIDVVAKKSGSSSGYSNNKIIIMVVVVVVFLVLGILVACLLARKKQNGKSAATSPDLTGGAVHGAPSFSMYGRDTNPFMYGSPTAAAAVGGKQVPQFVGGGDEFFLPQRAWNESASVFGRH